MADVKISALPAASTPLTGGEVLPIVQSSTTKQVAVSNLTAGLAGTASININGTVGATTPTTGAFTSGTFSTTLGVTGTSTLAAINASGVITASSGASASALVGDSTNAGGTALNLKNSGTTKMLLGGWSSIIGSGSANDTVLQAAGQLGLYSGATQGILINGAAVTIPGTLGVTGNATFDTDTLFVDAANNRVGIGTTSPGAKLHVSGSGNNTGFVKIENTTSSESTINFVTTHPSNYRVGASILLNGGFEIYDATAALNRLTISSAGAVTIPVTLGLNGAAANGIFAIAGRSGLPGIFVLRSNTAQSFAVEDDGNIYAGQIGASTGTALILSGGYIKTLTSSRRYKKDEEPIDIGLDFINTLKPIKFRLKENDLPQVGFIAEDFPDERLVDMSYIDIENKELGMRPESVHYSQITAPLVKAVQELAAKVAALEAK